MRATLLTRGRTWALFASLLLPGPRLAADSGWSNVVSERGVTVQARGRDDGVNELRATGIIDAPTDEVFGLLCDVRSTFTLVPHLKQLTILAERKDLSLTYQRLEVPTLAPRDFTIRAACRVEPGNDGVLRRVSEWHTDNSAGPAQVDGVVRLDVNEGSWVLEEVDGGRRTRAIYRIKIDPGGDVPRFIVNTAMQIQVPQLFATVAKEATVAMRATMRR